MSKKIQYKLKSVTQVKRKYELNMPVLEAETTATNEIYFTPQKLRMTMDTL